MKKRLLLSISMLAATPMIAYADSGTISNPYGEAIVGVWVEVKDG